MILGASLKYRRGFIVVLLFLTGNLVMMQRLVAFVLRRTILTLLVVGAFLLSCFFVFSLLIYFFDFLKIL